MRSKARNAAHQRVAVAPSALCSMRSADDGRDQLEIVGRFRDRLAVPLADVDDGGDAERDQECDDQHRHRAAQNRLGGQQPPISGLRDRLRQSLDGIGTRRRARAFGARHRRPPFRIVPVTLDTEGCAASLRISSDLNPNRIRLVESQSYENLSCSVEKFTAAIRAERISVSSARKRARDDVAHVGRQVRRRRDAAAARPRRGRGGRARARASCGTPSSRRAATCGFVCVERRARCRRGNRSRRRRRG